MKAQLVKLFNGKYGVRAKPWYSFTYRFVDIYTLLLNGGLRMSSDIATVCYYTNNINEAIKAYKMLNNSHGLLVEKVYSTDEIEKLYMVETIKKAPE